MSSEELKPPSGYPAPTSYFSAPFVWLNWCCRWAAYWASNLGFFQALEYAGKLGVLVAVVTWLLDIPEQRQAAIRTAWSVVNAKGGGRKESLEYLSHHKVDLRGLYGAGGYFSAIKLRTEDDLSWADLEGANFEKATLASVKLMYARLSGVRFNDADLKNGDLTSARFGPSSPDFTNADIAEANFVDVTGLEYGGYLAISKAKNWRKARFSDGVAELIECAELGDKASPKCKLEVPGILSGVKTVESQLFVQALIQNITCELRDAVGRVYAAAPSTFLDTWIVQTTLTLTVGSEGSTGQAIRTDKIGSYYSVSDLKKNGACSRAARPSDEKFLLQSDLKLTEWLFFVLGAYGAPESNAGKPPPVHETVLQHEVKFIVVTNKGPNPSYKLAPVSIEPAKARSPTSTEAPGTYDLLVTIAPPEASLKKPSP